HPLHGRQGFPFLCPTGIHISPFLSRRRSHGKAARRNLHQLESHTRRQLLHHAPHAQGVGLHPPLAPAPHKLRRLAVRQSLAL
ncbi:MAG: hypothetical protein ACK56I_30185, partial [bacterium]